MTEPLDVLLVEIEPDAGARSASELSRAGHRVHRCYPGGAPAEAGSASRRCVALRGAPCPIDRGAIDVAVVAGATDAVAPPPAGVTCALRHHIPVVADSSCSPQFGAELVSRADDGVVDGCLRARDDAFAALRDEVLAHLGPAAVAEGVDPDAFELRFATDGPRLLVTLAGPTLGLRREQILGVRVLDVVRDADLAYGPVDVAYERTAA